MEAVIYCRISQDREGAGLGVGRQEEDCRELAKSLGWTVVRVFADNDTSAYSGKPRPEYERMLAYLQAHPETGLLAWHPDRLHRSITELETFIDAINASKVEVRTVRAGHLDLSTPSGKMTARLLGVVARHESEHSAARGRRAKSQLAREGKYRGGGRPFGYKDGGMVLVPEEADALRDAAEQVLRGVSLTSIKRQFKEKGIKSSLGNDTMTVTSIRRLLLRARNAGLVEEHGKIIGPALWPAIYDEDTHYALVALFADPSRKKAVSFERVHQGSGVYFCGKCGERMKVYTMGSKEKPRYKAYRCVDQPHLSMKKDLIDEYVDDLVVARLSREDVRLTLKESEGVDVGELRVERDSLQARKDELASLFAEGAIDGSQLRRASAELDDRLVVVDRQLAVSRESNPVADLVLSGGALRDRWLELSADVRGKIIERLVKVTILPLGKGQHPRGGGVNPDRVRIEWKQ